MEIGEKNCKHLFLDIVGYSKNRTVEAQTEIIAKLNDIVRKVLTEYKLSSSKFLLLPTGDGICITFVNNSQYDFAIVFAVKILELIKQANEQTNDNMRKFEIRIGINENSDNIIIDINKRKNVAGSGINYAQRIMSVADGDMIMIGSSVYEQVNKRDKYFGKFKKWNASIKHGETLSVYQYIDDSITVLNTQTPNAFKTHNDVKMEINLTERLSMYLALVYKGCKIYGSLSKNVFDSNYIVVMLYYLANNVNDHLINSKSIIKEYAGNIFDSVTNEGRTVSITKALEEIKNMITYGLMISDLSDYVCQKLIEHNNAGNLFKDSKNPIQLSAEGQLFVEKNCKEQIDFIQEVK